MKLFIDRSINSFKKQISDINIEICKLGRFL